MNLTVFSSNYFGSECRYIYMYILTANPGSPGRPGCPMSPTSPRNPASPRAPFAPVSPTSPGGPGSPGLPTLTAVIIIPSSASLPCLVLLIYTQYILISHKLVGLWSICMLNFK